MKLADFGLARIIQENEKESMSHQICTRHYRPPELLFAARKYDFALDIWGIAVIFIELILGTTLFPGQNDIDQMYKVFQVLGNPTPERWPVCRLLLLPLKCTTC